MIITIGISIISIFIIFILLKKNKDNKDYWLILTNILLAGLLTANLSLQTGLTELNYIFSSILPFLIFPVFITYGLLLLEVEHQFKPVWLWIFSYAIVFTTFIILDFTLFTERTPSQLKSFHLDPPLIYHLFFKVYNLYVIGTSLWFLKKINLYRINLKEQYSFIEPIRLQWLKTFSWLLIGVYGSALVVFLIYNAGIIKDIDTVYSILNNTIVFAVFYFSYNGIKQYSLTQFHEELSKINQTGNTLPPKIATEELEQSKPKYKSSSLDDSTLKKIFENLNILFNEEHLYTDSQLKITQVADQLSVSVHQLSQVINSQFGNSFFEYVNTYRVKFLKKKLENPENKQFTILALAYDSGFNSKASLNRIFKRQTNQTPSQYQKAHLLE